MRKVVIIAKTVVGARPVLAGNDIGLNALNPFKKSHARLLKDKLNLAIKENKLDYTLEIDQSYDSPSELIKNGADLLLISPLVKKFLSDSEVNEFAYYELSEDEFYNTNIENIIAYLKAF